MADTGVVHCEKLLAVIDPAVSSWWLRTLEVTDESIFAGGGRLEDVAEATAIEAAVTARRRGFHPILLCASSATRQRLGDAFAQRGRSGHFLVQGPDNEYIRALLLHPSRDVLLGWLGRKKLVVPTREYYNALQEWLAHDALYQAFRQSIEQRDIHLSDFQLVTEPDVASEEPRQTYEWQWQSDPARKLALGLALDTHEAILTHSVAGRPVSDAVQMGADVLRFDSRGEYTLDGSRLARMVEQFDLPEAYRFWDDADVSPSRLYQLARSVREWWQGTSTVLSELLTPEQWYLLIARLELEPIRSMAGVERGLVRDTPAQTYGAPLDKPLLSMINDQPDLQFTVQWQRAGIAVVPEFAAPPTVQVTVEEQPVNVRSTWGQEWGRLTIGGLELHRPYRYAYAWNVEQKILQIKIAQQGTTPYGGRGTSRAA